MWTASAAIASRAVCDGRAARRCGYADAGAGVPPARCCARGGGDFADFGCGCALTAPPAGCCAASARRTDAAGRAAVVSPHRGEIGRGRTGAPGAPPRASGRQSTAPWCRCEPAPTAAIPCGGATDVWRPWAAAGRCGACRDCANSANGNAHSDNVNIGVAVGSGRSMNSLVVSKSDAIGSDATSRTTSMRNGSNWSMSSTRPTTRWSECVIAVVTAAGRHAVDSVCVVDCQRSNLYIT